MVDFAYTNAATENLSNKSVARYYVMFLRVYLFGLIFLFVCSYLVVVHVVAGHVFNGFGDCIFLRFSKFFEVGSIDFFLLDNLQLNNSPSC